MNTLSNATLALHVWASSALRRREGAGALEYMLIIVAISIIMFVAFRFMGEQALDWFNERVICEFSDGTTVNGSTCPA